MVTTVLVVLMILALLEIVLLNGARLFFMIVCHAGRDPDAGRKSWRADRTSGLCHADLCKQMGLEPDHEL